MLDEYIKIKHYEDLFGFVAVEKGFITQDELSKAQEDHVQEEIKGGAHRHLREILFYQGTMSANQIEEVVKVVVGHPEGATWNGGISKGLRSPQSGTGRRTPVSRSRKPVASGS